MNRYFLSSLAFFFLLLSNSASAVPQDKQIYTIGVIAPLTGKGASRGESARRGLELAKQHLAQDPNTKHLQIQLSFQDVPLDKAKQAPIAFTHLSKVEKVCAIIGPMGSTAASSIVELAERYRMPTIVHTASAKSLTQNPGHIFRLWPSTDSYSGKIIEELHNRKWSRLAAISTQHENTVDLLKSLSKEIDFISDERVSPDEADFRPILLRLKSQQRDAVFLNLFIGQIGLAARQARELGIETPFFTNAVMSKTELETADQALEGAWFPRFYGLSDLYREKFKQKFGELPSDPDSAAAAHDSLIVAAQAIAAHGCRRSDFINFIGHENFSGSIGTFKFEGRDARVPLALYKVTANKISLVD